MCKELRWYFETHMINTFTSLWLENMVFPKTVFKIQSCVLFMALYNLVQWSHSSNLKDYSYPDEINSREQKCQVWSSKTLATWCENLTHCKRPWSWERLRAGREGGNRGWDVWMASLIQRIWVWANSGRWSRTGKPGVQQSMGLQRAGHDLTSEQQCDLMKSHILKMKATFYLFSSMWSQIGYRK